ncbi:hypothetical protein BBO99_00009674 [Phytophthora kernoviae]|uniref:WRKY19-like zinc finger domain-containing protein n=2 Tax=Phytophthora kernoviae TaxID=325452 RepID=A0A3R7N9T0_9STRA|nr:hypothetical protein G195_011587 [Phytophthora kernoviae 00238/432]KAG2502821.1 hypothetical protein JM16_009586 [Phytophthora kernoviae]KAG2502997.1 hypothetical protein JM18_009691 [Phytophthora kernoviae]RLN36995.1 hypothetical protein BBI17_009714 [Phytophthora kernoviae]RLN72824.1 hypothetical protein BBO99_00009674 [Phytophthora kernoviae]
MPLGEKLGRPFELLSLIGRKRKDEAPEQSHQRLSTQEAAAYSAATEYPHACGEWTRLKTTTGCLVADATPGLDGCVKAAQSRGMCKAHGGGVRCRVDGCAKSSQGDGFCRSHGGGRRCGHPSGCSKWAQRNGMCMAHSEGKYGNSYRGRQHRMEDNGSTVVDGS